MPDMIDAVVLIQAIGVEIGVITREALPRLWDQARASHCLVREAERLSMSAFTWYEVRRGLRTPEQVAEFKIYENRFHIPPIDARVAKRAAEIYQAARSRQTLCPKCLCSTKRPATCAQCGSQRSTDQRSGDIVMVATAEMTSGVTRLYSWDGGVLALADHISGVHIDNPPPPSPEQLDMYNTVNLDAARERRRNAGSGNSE